MTAPNEQSAETPLDYNRQRDLAEGREQAMPAVKNLLAHIETLRADRDEWRQQHENLLAIKGDLERANAGLREELRVATHNLAFEDGYSGTLEKLVEGQKHRAEKAEQQLAEAQNPKPGLICGTVAISTDPRYAGWVFVQHVDGENWTTGAKLTPETWKMIKP